MNWKQILDTANDEYLIGISNKGILKRAYKDKEESGQSPEIAFSGDELEIEVGGEKVQICFPLQESKCSCASRSICRHIVSAILYAKEQVQEREIATDESEAVTGEEEENTNSEITMLQDLWQELCAYPKKKLFRILGTKRLSALSEQMEKQSLPQMEESSIITVKLSEDNAIVKLLSPLEYTACSCHKKDLCVHKAEAILWCQWQKKALRLEELKEQLEQTPKFDREQIQSAAKEMKNYLEELLQMGLSRSSVEVVDELERFAIVAHNAELPRMENRLRSLSDNYRKYIKRSANFSVSETERRLLELYKDFCKLINAEQNQQISELAGEFHAQYKPVGDLDLVGITMEHFASQSGYEGHTIYFLEEHTKKWYSYSNVRPVFYEKKRKNAFTQKVEAPWGLSGFHLEELANVRIHLKNAKADEKGRLSSTQESRGEVTDSRRFTRELVQEWYYKDFSEVFEKQIEVSYENESEEERQSQKLVFLQPNRYDKAVFDEVKQILQMSLYDAQNRRIQVEVSYSQKEKNTIRYLERLKEQQELCFLGRLYVKEGQLCFYPLDLFDTKELAWEEEEDLPLILKNTCEELSEEIEEYQMALESIAEFLTEIDTMLCDLYQMGFTTVQESVLQEMEKLMRRASHYGMNGLLQELLQLKDRISEQRHQVQKSEESQSLLFEAYVVVYDYIVLAKKKVMYDKAKLGSIFVYEKQLEKM